MSLAAKYTERISFKFKDFAETLGFNQAQASFMTIDILRAQEVEILTRIGFRVGDSAEPNGF
jgi:hypothetical protein